MDSFKQTYTEPVISAPPDFDSSKSWRIVWYEMTSPGEWKRARPTGDINRIAGTAERIVAAKLLCKMISAALKKGWRYCEKKQVQENTAVNVVDALTAHAKSKAASLSTVKSGQSYISWSKLFTDWMKQNKLAHLTIDRLTPVHVQLYIDAMIEKGKSNRTINTNLIGVGGVFNRIKKLYRLQNNPFYEVDKLRETESELFEPMTAPELTTINMQLRTKNPGLRLALLHVYYTFLRPASILQLRRSHYDFTARLITVPGKHHKNRKATVKQILQPLYDALIEAGIDKLPPDHYIFSKNLLPGVTAGNDNSLNKAWRRDVIEGMGINKKLYASKHTGASDFVNANAGQENLPWFQKQMGHSSLAESAAYVNKAKVVKLDEKKVKIKKL